MPMREYVCTTVECPENTGHLDDGSARIIEMLVGMYEEPDCTVCGCKLKQVINKGPRGYVRGSINPCIQ